MSSFSEIEKYQDEARARLASSTRRPAEALPFWERWCRLHDVFAAQAIGGDAVDLEREANAFLKRRKAFLSSLFQTQENLPAHERETELLDAISSHDRLFREAVENLSAATRDEVAQARKVQRTVSAYASSSVF